MYKLSKFVAEIFLEKKQSKYIMKKKKYIYINQRVIKNKHTHYIKMMFEC